MSAKYYNVEVRVKGEWLELLHYKALTTCQSEARRARDNGSDVRIRLATDNHLVDYVPAPKKYYPEHLYKTAALRLKAELRAREATMSLAETLEPFVEALNAKEKDDEKRTTNVPPFM